MMTVLRCGQKMRGTLSILCFIFLTLQADLIYESHADLFGSEEMELEEIATIVIGCEMKKIFATNEELSKRLKHILEGLLGTKENSPFIRNMVSESGRTVEEVLNLMTRLQTGLNQW